MIKSFLMKFKSKLTWKMLCIYIGMALLPSVIIGANYFRIVRNYLKNEEKDLLQNTLEQYCDDIDANLESAENAYYQIIQNTNFLRFLEGQYASQGAQVSIYISEFDTMFSYSFLSSRFIEDINVYMVNDSLLEMGDYLHKIDELEDYAFDRKINAGYWYYDMEKEKVIFRRTISRVKMKSELGILEITCNDDIILEFLKKLERNDRSIRLLYNDRYYDVRAQEASVRRMAIEAIGQLSRMPLEIKVETTPSINNNIVFSLLISIGCFILIGFFLFLVLYRLSRRITKFSQSMANHLNDSPEVYIDNGYDELSKLIHIYNDMVINNDYLLNQVKIEKLHQQETEYKALQSQINPHFIYNSLEGIRMMAEMRDATDVADVIFSLSVLMRYTFSISDNEVTLAQELEYINQYIKIQKMRLGEKIRFRIECDKGVKELNCPKFSIQPIIENSVKYGFGSGISEVRIYIRAEFINELVHIRVSNSGQKIPEEKLIDMNLQLRTGGTLKKHSLGNGVGLDNINNRMKYLHKESFFMQVSNLEQGVAVDLYWDPNDTKNNSKNK